MDRYVLEFEKITDVIVSKEPICELFKLNEDFWLKTKLIEKDHIFFHITEKSILDFLSGKVNMAGLLNNTPGDQLLLFVEGKGIKVRFKHNFDYKKICFWKRFYSDFQSEEITKLNKFIKKSRDK